MSDQQFVDNLDSQEMQPQDAKEPKPGKLQLKKISRISNDDILPDLNKLEVVPPSVFDFEKNGVDDAKENDVEMVKNVPDSIVADGDGFGFLASDGIVDYRLTAEKKDFDFLDLENKKVIMINELRRKSMQDLLVMATEYDVGGTGRMLKQDIVCSILKKAAFNGEIISGRGVLETMPEGFGFLRSIDNNYIPSADDVYISVNQIKKFGLRTGDEIFGYIRDPKKSEKYFSIAKIEEVNGGAISDQKNKINFDNLTPIFPTEKINLDLNLGINGGDISTRVIDLVSPIGKGQRALIVAPPRTGKTVLMQNIAHAINKNHPEIALIVLLIDERPEEVTDMARSVKGEVVSSTFDEPASRHVALAEIVIARAKRMVEGGKDVVILMDSLTRLARAYNTVIPSSGKVLTGGVDANALQRPKRILGAARNIEGGGSLTIIATALVETGSKMDEVIFEEFKGTGNSEIVLDRKSADRRLFPAIDVLKSGTRKEEEMIDAENLSKRWMLRRLISQMSGQMSGSSDALEFMLNKIKGTKDNTEFFTKMNG